MRTDEAMAMQDLADELERKDAEIVKLRAALEAIAQQSLDYPLMPAHQLGHIAERALHGDEQQEGKWVMRSRLWCFGGARWRLALAPHLYGRSGPMVTLDWTAAHLP